jgi:hypothetical protein
MTPTVRLAVKEDATAVRSCVTAAFEHYIERIGKPPAPMLLDFSAEIKSQHVCGFLRKKRLAVDTT